jgi:hypothetical protein
METSCRAQQVMLERVPFYLVIFRQAIDAGCMLSLGAVSSEITLNELPLTSIPSIKYAPSIEYAGENKSNG